MSGLKKTAPAARTRIGKYEIGKTLGEGSFAKVKYARDIHTGHSFAIKVIPRDLVLRHELAEQIKREISTMKLIQHPNVLNLIEVMASKTKIYIVLEYVDGGELFDKIAQQGRLSEDEARGYFQQLINAVDYCHSRGVYHRDLKPENLLLDSFGTLKVSDFGLSALSQQLRGDGLLHTACGTPNYVAPEVLTDRGYDGTSSDVWSCGVILFVLMAGYLPFDEPSLPALYRMIQKADFTCPPWFSSSVKELIKHILVPDPRIRMTIPEILESDWFKKGYKPQQFEQENNVNLDDIDAIFDDSEKHLVTVKKEKPESLNAFELISNQTLPSPFFSLFARRFLSLRRNTRYSLVERRVMRSSSANGVAGDRTSGSNGGSATVDKGVDFANYFCTYAFLYHQKEMLSDRVRMDAYFNSIFKNKSHFLGKVVLDVGTGSGILAIWSAQAGAKKVYAVEATKMAEHARELVKANKLQDVVEVIEGSIEDVILPEKVDVIISEWMGYFLLRESMFDSVICARDRWLKPTGVMYPSHARMWLAPIRSGLGDHKMSDYEGSMDDWHYFLKDAKNYYGVDMSVLTKPFSEEQKKYYLQTSMWNNLHPSQVIGTAAIIKEIDCLTVTVEDILSVRATLSSSITKEETRLCGFGGWFDVHFQGSQENPAEQEIELTTAPSEDHITHWGQQVFLLHPPIHVRIGDDLNINFAMSRSKENHRLMEVELSCETRQSSGKLLPTFKNKFYIE